MTQDHVTSRPTVPAGERSGGLLEPAPPCDVTESKRIEAEPLHGAAELGAIMDAVPAIVWVTRDPGGEVITGNRASREFLRIPGSANTSKGAADETRPFVLWEQGREVPPEESPIRRAARTGLPQRDQEMEVVFEDGSRRHLFGHVVPLLDGAGGPAGARGAFVDLTDLHHADEERSKLLASERAARAETERVGRLKDEFLATLSHELRSPLSAILGWTQILRMGVEPDQMARAVEVIYRNARMQAQLIDDLLDMHCIVSGRIRLEARLVELVPLLESAIDSVRPATEAKRITVAREIAARPCILGDLDRMQQVLWNLLSNAVKFTPEGGHISVSLLVANGHVGVEVADSGIGIDPAFLPYVFDRFRQGDASTTRKHAGLGLGLSIVKNLVELHGGTVAARSAGPRRGATFLLRFPLATAFDAASASPPGPAA
jgi:signal transduction histidine kinase